LKVIILAGGKGVRYDIDKPKALAMIGNKPIIYHLMNIYSQQGYNEFIVCLGWHQEYITDYFTRTCHNFKIEFVDTGQDSHTAKRLKLIEKYIPYSNDNFFCTYCDGLSNVNLMKLQVRHTTHKNIATLTAVRPINQFGVLHFDNNGNIEHFEEKPKMEEFINGGFFIFNKKIFSYIDITKNQELEKDILKKLVEVKQLGCYKHNEESAFWETLNTVKDEINLNNILSECTRNQKEPVWLRI